MKQPRVPRGLVMVNTGDGKGKTTAGLGLALRAIGQGLRVTMIQFVKGNERTGEHMIAERLGPGFTLKTMGVGFVVGEWTQQDIAAARAAWDAARDEMAAGGCDLLILDEITYCLRDEVIPLRELLGWLESRLPQVHVLLTGRDAPPELVAAADLVTEMQCVKHPYDAGIGAQRGVEF